MNRTLIEAAGPPLAALEAVMMAGPGDGEETVTLASPFAFEKTCEELKLPRVLAKLIGLDETGAPLLVQRTVIVNGVLTSCLTSGAGLVKVKLLPLTFSA